MLLFAANTVKMTIPNFIPAWMIWLLVVVGLLKLFAPFLKSALRKKRRTVKGRRYRRPIRGCESHSRVISFEPVSTKPQFSVSNILTREFWAFGSGKGADGERNIYYLLRQQLPEGYEILNDVYLPSVEGETTQIDHVVVSEFGVFVVETKNWDGWIFGEEQSVVWTQCLFKKKSKVQNPLRQNYKHVCELSRNLGVDKQYFHSVVALAGDCEFKGTMPKEVVYGDELPMYIKSFTTPMIKPEQVHELVTAILEWQATISPELKSAHTANLHRRHATKPRE